MKMILILNAAPLVELSWPSKITLDINYTYRAANYYEVINPTTGQVLNTLKGVLHIDNNRTRPYNNDRYSPSYHHPGWVRLINDSIAQGITDKYVVVNFDQNISYFRYKIDPTGPAYWSSTSSYI